MTHGLRGLRDGINNTVRDIYTSHGKLYRIFVPFGISFTVLITLSLIYGGEIMPKLLSVFFLYSIPFIDILPAFALGLSLDINYYIVSLWLLTAETCEALFVAWNFDHLNRFKWFQDKIRKSHVQIEKYKWFQKLRVLAVTFITIIPVAAAGAIIAPIVGRFLGLPVGKTVLGVIIGSFLRFAFFILLIEGFLAIF